jgi:cell division protein FtsA
VWFKPRKSSRQTQIAAVLDAGSHKLCCLIGRVQPPPKTQYAPGKVQLLGYAYRQSEGIAGGAIVDMQAAERAVRQVIAKAERMADLAVERIYVTASAGQIYSECLTAKVPLQGGVVRDADVARALSAARNFASGQGKVALATHPIGFSVGPEKTIRDPRGLAGEMLAVNVHSILAEPSTLANFKLCVERGHLGFAGFAASAHASALGVISPEEAEAGVIAVDLGAGCTNLSAFAGGSMVYAGNVKRGGRTLTYDLSQVFGVNMSEAERLKSLYGNAFLEPGDAGGPIVLPTADRVSPEHWLSLPKAELCGVIRYRQEEIFADLLDGLQRSNFDPAHARCLVLTGGGSQLVGVAPLAQRMFGCPVRLAGPKPFMGGQSPAIGAAFAAAAGLLSYLHEEDWEFRPAPANEGPGPGYLTRVGEWLLQGF